MPLLVPPGHPQDGGMRSSCGISVADEARSRAARHPRRSTLILTDGPGWRPRRITDRALARAFGGRLDRRLAAGRSPESARLLAARAQDLVSPATRQALADDWEYVLDRAKNAPAPAPGQMALHRDWIV